MAVEEHQQNFQRQASDASPGNTSRPRIGAMNRSTIYISSCMAVGVLLFPALVDPAHAACDPPRDVSSCVVLSKELLAQPSPALPKGPFVVADPQTGKRFAMTHF